MYKEFKWLWVSCDVKQQNMYKWDLALFVCSYATLGRCYHSLCNSIKLLPVALASSTVLSSFRCKFYIQYNSDEQMGQLQSDQSSLTSVTGKLPNY